MHPLFADIIGRSLVDERLRDAATRRRAAVARRRHPRRPLLRTGSGPVRRVTAARAGGP